MADYSKADALQQAMQEGQKPPDPMATMSLWDKIKALLSTEGRPWADTADSMLPEDLAAREAILRRRQQAQMLDELNRT